MGMYLAIGYVVLGMSVLVWLFVASIFVRMILSGIRSRRMWREFDRREQERLFGKQLQAHGAQGGKVFVRPVEEARKAPASGNLFVHKDEGNPYAFERRWFK